MELNTNDENHGMQKGPADAKSAITSDTPDQTTELKHEIIRKKRLTPIALILIIVVIAASYLLYESFKPSMQLISDSPQKSNKSVTSSSTTIPLYVDEPSVPDPSALYTGLYEGKEVLIKRSCSISSDRLIGYNNAETISHITDPNDAKYIVFVTALNADEAYNQTTPVDFRAIQNSKEILVYPVCNYSIPSLKGSVTYNENKSKLYVSIEESALYQREYKILQIDLLTNNYTILWFHKVIDGKATDAYDSYTGSVYIDQIINDSYIVFSLWMCTGCTPPPDRVSIILNVNTFEEKYLGLVGNIQVDIDTNSFTYQNLTPFEESCEGCFGPCYGCMTDEDGVFKKTVLIPSGAVITKTLP